MSNYQDKLNKLRAELASDKRPDMLIAFAKALGIAFFSFTFLAGLIFTVIPLMRNVYLHFIWHFVEPINRWVAAEPVTGSAIMFLFQVAGAVIVIWLLRSYLMFIPTYIMASVEKNNKNKPKKVVKKKPTKPVVKSTTPA